MLRELREVDPKLAIVLGAGGASKPTTVLNKYFVEGKRVTGVIGEDM